MITINTVNQLIIVSGTETVNDIVLHLVKHGYGDDIKVSGLDPLGEDVEGNEMRVAATVELSGWYLVLLGPAVLIGNLICHNYETKKLNPILYGSRS